MTSQERFTGDRYERLIQAAAVLAADPAVSEAPDPFGVDGLMAFVDALTERQVLDGLTDADADVVSMMSLLGFYQGFTDVEDSYQDVVNGESAARRRAGQPEVDAPVVAQALADASAVADALNASLAAEG